MNKTLKVRSCIKNMKYRLTPDEIISKSQDFGLNAIASNSIDGGSIHIEISAIKLPQRKLDESDLKFLNLLQLFIPNSNGGLHSICSHENQCI